jgi:thiamine-phosphate pyrophosphorylase
MRVHAIVDDLETARRAAAAGATVVQLRVKAPTDEVIERGRGFRALGTVFVVNDDVEAAFELGADGVHLGDDDPGAERARARGLLLGRSIRCAAEALDLDADYIGLGPIWPTPSKTDAGDAVGIGEITEATAYTTVPIVAIGGIDASNAGDCIRAGAAGVAVIRAATDPELRRAVDEAFAAR